MAVAGRIMPVPKGEYDASTIYDALDIVSYNNRPWICRKNKTLGIEPSTSNSNFWMMLINVDITNADTLDGKKASYFMSKTEMMEMFKTHQIIFRSENWEGEAAPYTQRIEFPEIKSTDEPFTFFIDDGETTEDSTAKRKAYTLVSFFDSENSAVTATCKYEKPTVDFTVGFKGVLGQNG